MSLHDKLNEMSGKAMAAGTTLTASLTLPIVAMGAASLKASIDYETAFSGVRKTVTGTPAELEAINEQFREMARVTPVSAVGLAKIGEMAGQLGVEKSHLIEFTKTIVDISTATNLTADEAGSAFARLANVMRLPQTEFSNLGSAVVALGNFGASTEQEMLSMAQRISAAGASAGFTTPQVLGIANALSSVGIEAEAGGTAISKVISKMATDVATGGGHLKQFAETAGMTTKQFQHAFEVDAGMAFSKFMEGLSHTKDKGESLFATMQDLGFTEVRLKNAMLAAANSGDLMTTSIALGTKAFAENTELARAAEERYKTTANQLKVLENNITDVAITIGNAMLPWLNKAVTASKPFIEAIAELAKWFSDLPAAAQLTVLAFGATVAAIGPALLVFGGMARGVVSLMEMYTALVPASAAADAAIVTTTGAVTGLDASMTVLALNPIVLALVGIGLAAFAMKEEFDKGTSSMRYQIQAMSDLKLIHDGFHQSGPITTEQQKQMQAAFDRTSDAIYVNNKAAKDGASIQVPFKINLDQTGDALASGAIKAKVAAQAQQIHTAVTKEAEKAAKAHATAIGKVGDAMTGGDIAKKARDLAEALAKQGGASALTAVQSEDLATKLNAMVKGPLGPAALPKSLHDVWVAHLSLTDILPKHTQTTAELLATQVNLVPAMHASGASATALSHEIATLETAMNRALEKGSDYSKVIKENGEQIRISTTHFSAAEVATRAIAEAHRQLSPTVQSSAESMLKAGLSAEQVYQAMVKQGLVLESDKPKIEALTRAHHSMGASLQALSQDFAHMAQIGGESFQGIAKSIGISLSSLNTMSDSLKTMKESVKSGLSLDSVLSFASGIGGMVSGVISGIGSLIKHFSAGRSEVEKFAESQGGFDTLHTRLLALGTAGEDYWIKLTQGTGKGNVAQAKAAIEAITKALDEQKGAAERAAAEQLQDASDLAAAVQKYGFTIEQLGPAMQRQELTKQAMQIENEFRLLAGSGIDLNLVLDKMAPNVNAFVQQAIRAGQSVPAEMEPILRKMRDLGALTDENGNLIGDFAAAGITFSETMTQGFDRVVKAVKELTTSLGLIPAVIAQIPTHVGVTVQGTYIPPDIPGFSGENPDTAHGGALVMAQRIQKFHRGTARVLPFGRLASDEVPAILQTGEAVLRREAVRALGSDTVRALNGMGDRSGGSAASTSTGGEGLRDEIRAMRADFVRLMSGDTQITVPVSISGERLDERTVRVTRAAMAKRQIPVPADAVRTRVANG